MIHEIWWSLPLTLAVYFAARWLARKLNMPLLNPLLVSMAVIIPLLLLTGIPYERYFWAAKSSTICCSRRSSRWPSRCMSSCTRSARAGNRLSRCASSAA